jgi:hypothetical protein
MRLGGEEAGMLGCLEARRLKSCKLEGLRLCT